MTRLADTSGCGLISPPYQPIASKSVIVHTEPFSSGEREQ